MTASAHAANVDRFIDKMCGVKEPVGKISNALSVKQVYPFIPCHQVLVSSIWNSYIYIYTIRTRLVTKSRFFGRNHVFIFTTGKSITPPQKPGFPTDMPVHTRCVQNTWVSLSHFGFLPLELGICLMSGIHSNPINSGWMRASSCKFIFYIGHWAFMTLIF